MSACARNLYHAAQALRGECVWGGGVGLRTDVPACARIICHAAQATRSEWCVCVCVCGMRWVGCRTVVV